MSVESLNHIDISIELQQSINSDLANHFGIIPKTVSEDTLTFFIDADKAHDLQEQ